MLATTPSLLNHSSASKKRLSSSWSRFLAVHQHGCSACSVMYIYILIMISKVIHTSCDRLKTLIALDSEITQAPNISYDCIYTFWHSIKMQTSENRCLGHIEINRRISTKMAHCYGMISLLMQAAESSWRTCPICHNKIIAQVHQLQILSPRDIWNGKIQVGRR